MALRLKNDASRIPFTAWWPQGAGGYMIFIHFGTWVHKNGKGQLVLPRESFTRFQLAAIFFTDSSIHRCWLAGWLAGWLAAGCWLKDNERGSKDTLDAQEGRRISIFFNCRFNTYFLIKAWHDTFWVIMSFLLLKCPIWIGTALLIELSPQLFFLILGFSSK